MSILLLVVLTVSSSMVTAFQPTTNNQHQPRRRHNRPLSSPQPAASHPSDHNQRQQCKTVRPVSILYSAAKGEGQKSNSPFEQRPGERDIDFIKRISMESEQRSKNGAVVSAGTGSAGGVKADDDGDDSTKPKSNGSSYQRIEDWDEERQKRSAGGELTWEERVQFDGQRHGDQVRQQWILEKHIGTFWRR
jgi:hypothetical protein